MKKDAKVKSHVKRDIREAKESVVEDKKLIKALGKDKLAPKKR